MLVESDVTCGVCGFREIGFRGTNDIVHPFEEWDLDLLSSVNMTMLDECKGCGACAPDISELPSTLRPQIESDEYRSLSRDDWHRRRILSKWAFVADVLGRHQEATEAIIEMSWLYEREAMFDEALRCQRDAVVRMKKDRIELTEIKFLRDQMFAARRDLQLVDLLRQTSQFDEAVVFAERLLKDPAYRYLHRLFEFEVRLCLAANAQRFAVADAEHESIPVKPTRAERADTIQKWKADRELHARREAASIGDANRFHAQLKERPHVCDHCHAFGGSNDYHLSIGRIGAVICRRCSWPQRVWAE